MFVAGFMTALAGTRQPGKNQFVGISILFQTLAIAITVVMDVVLPKVLEILAYGRFVNGP